MLKKSKKCVKIHQKKYKTEAPTTGDIQYGEPKIQKKWY